MPKQRKKVVFAVPRGEAYRNFVYNGIIEDLAEEMHVHAVAVRPSTDVWDLLSASVESLREFDEDSGTFHKVATEVRAVLDLVHYKTSGAVTLNDKVARQRAEIKRKVTSKTWWRHIVADTAAASRGGLETLVAAESNLGSVTRAAQRAGQFLDELQPDLIVNTSLSHSGIALPLIHAARKRGIATVGYLFSWDNITSQNRIYPEYDHYMVWNSEHKEQIAAFYECTPASNVHVVGTPQFDVHFDAQYQRSRETYCASLGVDPERPIVLYTTSMPYHTPEEEIIVERLANVIAERPWEGPRPQLHVRVYAKDKTSRFDPLRATRPDIVFLPVEWEPSWLTPLPGDAVQWVNAVRHADVGLNVASTVSLELCMLDKPVINIGYSPSGDFSDDRYAKVYTYDHYRPVVASGAVEVAWSEQEAVDLLRTALNDPARRMDERAHLVQSMFGDSLGQGAERLKEAILTIVSRHEKDCRCPNCSEK